MTTRLRLVAVGAVAAALALSACSSGGGSAQSDADAKAEVEAPADQTVEQACDVIYTGMDALATELSTFDGTDEAQAQEMVDAAKVSLADLDAQVTNPEVLAVWMPISELQVQGLEAATAQDQEAIMEAYLAMNEKYEAFWAVCPQEEAQSVVPQS